MKIKLFILKVIGFLVLALIATVKITTWTNTVEFIWQSPVRFYKPLQIIAKQILKPEYEVLPAPDDNSIILKVSHYNPDLGGTNCANFVNGECVSKMANGEDWQDNIGIAIACPRELEFGTKIKINDRVWECKDRGSRITKNGDVYWVDMNTPYALMPYGSIVVGELLK